MKLHRKTAETATESLFDGKDPYHQFAVPLILDTFNVLHTVGVLPPDLAGLDVPGLAELILRSRYAAEKVTFVCDGLPAADLPPPGQLAMTDRLGAEVAMQMRYSGRDATADDLIRLMVDASTAPRRVIVVSSDHAIQRHANRRRCVVLSSPDFLQHLADDANLPQPTSGGVPRTPSAMSEEQIERWKSVFRIDDAVAAALAPVTSPTQISAPIPESSNDSTRSSRTPIQPDVPSTPPIPQDLIAEAEALWKQESVSPAPASRSGAPIDPLPPSQNEQANERKDPASDDAPIELDADVDLANLDMNSILPRDGKTHLVRRNDKRHRPTPPSR